MDTYYHIIAVSLYGVIMFVHILALHAGWWGREDT